MHLQICFGSEWLFWTLFESQFNCRYCCSSVVTSSPTLCDPTDYGKVGSSVLHCLLEFGQIHAHSVSNAMSPFLPSPSIFWVFSNELALHIRWPMYWSFSFSISPSNEYSGLISSRIDCFGLLTVQKTLKSLPQYLSTKASVLQWLSFFIGVVNVQLTLSSFCFLINSGRSYFFQW